MKRFLTKIATVSLAIAMLVPVAVQAQKEKEDKEKKEKDKGEIEQIIITRKGDKNEKTIIEINGDKITVNGKNIEDLKDGDVTVNRHNIPNIHALRGLAGQNGNWNFSFNDDNMGFFSEDNNRAMLGVTTDKADEGAVIEEVTKESAAAKAGLKTGDIITKVGDTKITDPESLTKAVRSHKPGDKVSVTYLRDKKEQKTTAELGKWKGVKMNTPGVGDMKLYESMKPKVFERTLPNGQFDMFYAPSRPRLGLSVQDTDDGKGVKVLEVDTESNAAKAGVKENDIITHINDKEVNSADEVAKIVREAKDKPSIMVKLNRGGKTQNIEVKIPRKLKTADL